MPAAFATFRDVNPPGFVAAVSVVIAGKNISILIEGELLGIAETRMDDFEFAAVGIATHDRAGIGTVNDGRAVGDVEAAIGDGEIKFAVGTKFQAVQIVAAGADVHAKAGENFLADVGFAVVVHILQTPEIGNASEQDLAFARGDAGGDAGDEGFEIVGVSDRAVGDAIEVAVLEEANAFGFDLEIVPIEFAVAVAVDDGGFGNVRVAAGQDPLKELRAIVDGAERVIGIKPIVEETDVVCRSATAVGFDNEASSELVECKTGRIGEERFRGEQLGVKAGLEAELFHRRVDFGAGRKVGFVGDVRVNSVGVGEVGRSRLSGKERNREGEHQPDTQKNHGLQHNHQELAGQA